MGLVDKVKRLTPQHAEKRIEELESNALQEKRQRELDNINSSTLKSLITGMAAGGLGFGLMTQPSSIEETLVNTGIGLAPGMLSGIAFTAGRTNSLNKKLDNDEDFPYDSWEEIVKEGQPWENTEFLDLPQERQNMLLTDYGVAKMMTSNPQETVDAYERIHSEDWKEVYEQLTRNRLEQMPKEERIEYFQSPVEQFFTDDLIQLTAIQYATDDQIEHATVLLKSYHDEAEASQAIYKVAQYLMSEDQDNAETLLNYAESKAKKQWKDAGKNKNLLFKIGKEYENLGNLDDAQRTFRLIDSRSALSQVGAKQLEHGNLHKAREAYRFADDNDGLRQVMKQASSQGQHNIARSLSNQLQI